jgi:hypothetical protein
MMTSNNIPDFYIAGTMKGGTTVLYDFICMHDQVKRAAQKEIHYFSLYPYKGREWYLSHFDKRPGEIIGEASPTYFDLAYTDAIPRSIKEFNPAAKVIIITRNPVERAVSHFYHLQNINKVPAIADQDINSFFSQDFADCITVSGNSEYLLQQVLYFGAYSRKAMFYRAVFGRDQLLFLDNHELRSSPRGAMEKVFAFLGLGSFHDPAFERIKYSSGRNSDVLESKIKDKLVSFYRADYELYARMTGINVKNLQDV